MPLIFSDHMVLQRDFNTPVWGYDKPGTKITVILSKRTPKAATTDENGRWEVRLDPMPADASPSTLTIKTAAGEEKVYQNVLIGDVWICSGQSNMEWSVNQSLDPQGTAAGANYPNIRLFDVPGHTTAPLPTKTLVGGNWVPCSPASVQRFSAVGYAFGKEIFEKGNIPVGLIGTNWGGTRVEPWTPPSGFKEKAELKAISDGLDSVSPSTEVGRQRWDAYMAQIDEWVVAKRNALNKGLPVPRVPQPPASTNAGSPTAIYNSMVSPLIPYGVRGAIWYQGESNGGEGLGYLPKLQALV
ncbi:MAG: sialate O-acetylesterase, partial [Verrucomicrobiota bacterium]